MLAPGPSYISSSSADVILSDVRTIKLAHEALQAVNVLLDELLYTILNDAQSIATDKLKASLLKIIPTSLGKEALLEAEVELKSYTERNTPSSASGDSGGAQFSLQWVFELLRLKCEGYSTMNDSDEDGEAERRLIERMKESKVLPPQAPEVAPAALYLTAILESVCEHVLGNISSVAARDSSRTVATSQDVFTALCEDDAFYGTFKTLKVYEQIEQLSQAQRPRRSKSFTRGSDRGATPTLTPRASSATQAELAALRDGASTPARARMSMESLRSNSTATGMASGEGRMSMERGKSIRKKFMTHSRSSSEKEAEGELARSRASGDFEEDDELAHEFDELMRSGSTMKVSLTPDRLRTMEVFNKERTQRAKQTRETAVHFSDKPAGIDGNTHALNPERPRATASAARPMPRRVDSIVEDEEPTQTGPTTMSTTVVTTDPPRMRQASKSFTSSSFSSSAAARLRSISVSDSPLPRHESRRSQDQLPNSMPVNPGAPVLNLQKPIRQNSKSSLVGMPTRTRKFARHRESLDLDEVMNGSGDEGQEVEVVSPSAPPRTSSRAAATPPTTMPGKPKTPHISASARDLIAFLDEGPPEELEPSRSSVANASVISFDSSRTTRSGKLSRMMSKLTIGNGNSSERLNGRYGDDGPKTPKTPRSLVRKPSSNFGPPTAFKPSLANKRSFPNVVVSPPRVHPYHDGTQTPTPPQSISSGTRMVSPSPTASTAPLIPRAVSTASSTSDDSHTFSPLRSGSMRKGSSPRDEYGYQPSVSRDGSLYGQNANGSYRLKVVNGDMREPEEDGTSASKTNGHVPIVSPVPRNNDDRVVSPSTPRRSPVPRKPAPSPTQENGHSAAKETSRSRKPSPQPASSIVASDVADLRTYLQRAESVDECRLLVDMFFASHGFPAKPLADSTAPSLPELPRFMSLSELECSYAELFLSPDSIDFPSLADETSSEGSSASSRDFLSPTSEPSTSPTPFLATVQE